MGANFNRSGKRNNPGGNAGHRAREARKKQKRMAKLLKRRQIKGLDPNLAKKQFGE